MTDLSLAPLPPAEAIRYFRGKGLAHTFAWQDMWQEEHAKAFTVAKAMRPSVLQDIRDAVDAALADGTTLATFKKTLRPKLEAAGWWGRQKMVDPLTGEERTVQLGSPRRLRTIFDVNMRTAYAAGRWERAQETKKTIQNLRYQTAGDDRVRPEHAAWDGTTLPIDDPWWDTHNPPCDWGCRCTVIQISDDQLARDGESLTDRPVAFPSRSYTNPRTGEVVRVEGGIGPGWGYNVGKAYLERETPSPMGEPDLGEGGQEGLVSATAEIAPREVATELLAAQADPVAAFLAGFGASATKSVFFADKTGDGLVIGPALFKNSVGRPVPAPAAIGAHLELVGLALREPAEIWRAWRFGPEGDSLLVRRFIAAFRAGGRVVDVVVDWSAQGWWAATSVAKPLDLGALRQGTLAWSAET
jgi:SPP1 gp7 family putative phage head morphogenesis protein